MFGNMMSTAAGVGIGSAIGHSIGSLYALEFLHLVCA